MSDETTTAVPRSEWPARKPPKAAVTTTVPRRRTGWYAWAVPGLLTAVTGSIGLNGPGLWGDELATWGMATLSWGGDLRIVGQQDAVIAPYYAIIGVWSRVFGTSDIALRAPSVIAMALAAALTGAIGARLSGPRAGLFAGVVFALMPGTARFAQEARQYGFAVLGVTLATYLLLRVRERPERRRWVAYAVAVALTGLFHLVALLVLIAHGVVVRGWRERDVFRRWLVAALLGVAPCVPLLVFGAAERHQVAWIATFHMPLRAYADTSVGSLAGVAIVLAAALCARPTRYPGRLYAAWAVLPLLALLAVSLVIPLMLPRYLLFTLPAWALLVGAALARPHPAWAVSVLVVLAAQAIPWQASLRAPGGHENMATRQVAEIVDGRYQPGDAVVYGMRDFEVTCCEWAARDLIAHYLPPDRRPRDAFLLRPQRSPGQLLTAAECSGAEACLANPPRVWVIRLGYWYDPLTRLGDGKEEVLRARYLRSHSWHVPGFTVALLISDST